MPRSLLALLALLCTAVSAQTPAHTHAAGEPAHSHATPALDTAGRPVSPHLNPENPLALPFSSSHARTEQAIGVTRLAVDYSRPAAKGRVVWGGLVPYGALWRAGANATTVFEASTDLTVEGQPLAAGRYALRFVPTEAAWTAVFSSDPDTWGAEEVDAESDVLRVEVAPREGPEQERLAYRFDGVTDSSAVLVLAWGRLEVPLRLAVDVPETVLASMEAELTGALGTSPGAYEQAAVYALRRGRRPAAALAWAERAHVLRPSPATLGLRAEALAALGRGDEAQAARDAARDLDATEAERDRAAERLDRAGASDLALALYRRNAEANAGSWMAHDRLADALAARGDSAGAETHFDTALRLAPPDERHHIEAARAALRP